MDLANRAHDTEDVPKVPSSISYTRAKQDEDCDTEIAARDVRCDVTSTGSGYLQGGIDFAGRMMIILLGPETHEERPDECERRNRTGVGLRTVRSSGPGSQ